MSIHKKALFYGYNRCFVHGFDCLVDKQLSRIPSVHRYVSLVDKQGKARVRNKKRYPKRSISCNYSVMRCPIRSGMTITY